jgi:hypothetical protein
MSDRIRLIPAGHMATDLGDEFVILGRKDDTYFGVNGVGARVWELIQQPQTFHSLVATIADEFDVENERCKADIGSFLEELSNRAIIEIVPETAQDL